MPAELIQPIEMLYKEVVLAIVNNQLTGKYEEKLV